MTLQPQQAFSIPQETARVAHAAYPKGNLYMKMRDGLGTIYQDKSFAHLFPQNGRPVEAPWRLAFITVVQFIEDLPDRQAAEAVRGRIDLKYALGLELTDPGFDFTILSDFRARLVQGGGEQVLLDAMLTLFKERGWRKRAAKATHRFHSYPGQDSCHQSTAVCGRSDAFRASTVSLSLLVTGSWSTVMRSGCIGMGIAWKRGAFPKARRVVWKWQKPLDKMAGDCSPMCLIQPRQHFSGKFLRSKSCVKSGCRTIAMTTINCIGERPRTFLRQLDSSIRLTSKKPARRKKYSTRWTGYKVHLTETCEADQPHLLIHVATTPAPESDVSMTEDIQADLQEAQMLPGQHYLDTGYVNADVLATSQQRFGIEVISPTHPDVKWQANTDQGIDASQFDIDWEHKQALCPQGKTSVSWTPTVDSRQHEVIKIRFSTTDCQACPVLSLCTSSKSRAPRRLLSVRPQPQYEALQAARKLQATKEFSRRYALRSGIEATISQGVRAFGLRRSRYLGLAKTHLQHVGIAAAINLVRVVAWLDGDELAPTRVSAFQRLYAAA